MQKLIISWFFILYFTASAFSALKLSSDAQIMLLTCSPGQEIYSIYGHSAIRVVDNRVGIDKIYSYGTFDFNTPYFYVKFVKGNLDYLLTTTKFKYFVFDYNVENRSVYQQVLNLNPEQKQELFNNLELNYLPQNRAYRYDFFYDNCATRIRDIFQNSLHDSIVYDKSGFVADLNFRDLMIPYISYSPWLELGINLALGLPADKKTTPEEQMFLPDYLMHWTAKSYIGDVGVGNEYSKLSQQIVFNNETSRKQKANVPLYIFVGILVFSLGLSLYDYRKKRISFWFDNILFGIIGVLGCFIAFLWFGTEHFAMNQNLNVLWALPLNIVIVFFLKNKKFQKIVYWYFVVYSVLLSLLLISWHWFPQRFYYSLIFLVIALLVRSVNQIIGRNLAFYKK